MQKILSLIVAPCEPVEVQLTRRKVHLLFPPPLPLSLFSSLDDSHEHLLDKKLFFVFRLDRVISLISCRLSSVGRDNGMMIHAALLLFLSPVSSSFFLFFLRYFLFFFCFSFIRLAFDERLIYSFVIGPPVRMRVDRVNGSDLFCLIAGGMRAFTLKYICEIRVEFDELRRDKCLDRER